MPWPTAKAPTTSASPATKNPITSRPITASTAIRSEGGASADQANRTTGATQPTSGPRRAFSSGRRPPVLPAPLGAGRRRSGDDRQLAARQRAPGQGRAAADRRCAADDPQKHLHPLRGRLHGHRRGRQRRVDRPGTELGQPDQSRLALCQGCRGARARLRRAAAQIPDEIGQRRMDPGQMGPGDQRDRRQAARDPRKIRPGFGVLARLGQIHQ